MADFNSYRPQKCVPAEKVRLCAQCKALMVFDGLVSAQSLRGFVHNTVGGFNTNRDYNGSPASRCSICTRIETYVSGYRDCPSDSWLVVFRGQLSPDGDGIQTLPIGQQYKEHFGLRPLGELRLGTQDPDDADGHSFKETELMLTLVADDRDPASAFVFRRPAFRDFSNPMVICAARSWLDECRSKHKECPGDNKPILPTRVIDVGGGDQGDTTACDPNGLKLHISSPGDRADYACLSYCWGGPQAVISTTKTLPDLVDGFSLQSLGQTIQDAVAVTRAMETRYLWVDALCIIQDDGDDKAREIGKMQHIYKSSTYTIAAGTASSSSMGFLPPTGPGLAQMQADKEKSIHFRMALPDGQVGNVFLYFDLENVTPEKEPESLDKRGWTLQEYLLPSRVLHFTRRQLLVECQHDNLRQLQPTNLYYDKSSFPRYQFSKAIRANSRGEHPWPLLVQEFTHRNLTDPEDRLNAVAGIAAEFAELRALRTHAFGFQEPDFILQLGWYVREPENMTDRSSRAPTWSWASINGPVEYHKFDHAQVKARLVSELSPQSRVAMISGKVLHQWPGGEIKLNNRWLDTTRDMLDARSNNIVLLLLYTRIAPIFKRYDVAMMLLARSRAGGRDRIYYRIGLVEFPDMKVWANAREETFSIV